MKEPGWGTLQHYYTIPYYVAVKFAMWDSILSMPQPESSLIYPRAVLHYARGMAYLGKNDITNAGKELLQLQTLSKDSVLKKITIWDINNTHELIQIAVNVLFAEILQKQNKYGKAIPLFQKAIAKEDNFS